MTPTDAAHLISAAWKALQAGQRSQAQRLLAQALEREPRNGRAWLLLAAAVDDTAKKRYCLEKALALQPGHPAALRMLAELEPPRAEPIMDTETPAASAAPPAHPADRPAAAAQSAAETPVASPPARRTRRSGRRSCLAGLLALLAMVALALLASIAAPGWLADGMAAAGMADPATVWRQLVAPLPAAQDADAPAAALQPLPTIGIPRPPTWTPAPTSTYAAPGTPLPTLDLFGADDPAASITPFWGEWKLVIGRSVEGRPLEVYRFGSGKKERMIVAGIHGGDEWNTIALADQLIEYVRKRPGLVPPGYSLYILRALNPDGEARDHSPKGRYNANGVDLNRNFSTNWKSTWRAAGCSSDPGTGGSGPGSEPETQALEKFLAERHVEALISYHSAGLGVFPSGDPAQPESVRLAQEIAAISDYVYPPVKTGCEYTGTLVDWAADHGVTAAVDLELNSLKETEFDANRKILELLMRFDVQRPASTP